MEEFDIKKKALCVEFDPQDRFYTCRWNLRGEVKAELNLPQHVTILDTTLREGEDTPWVFYTLEQKLQIARALEEIGVPEIDCGFASLSKEHLETVKAVKAAGLSIKTMAITRVDVANPEAAIGMTIDAGADIILIAIYGVPIPGFGADDFVNLIEKSVSYTKKRGAFCSFWVPVTRWEQAFAERLYKAAVRGGADRVEIAGAGCVGPTAFKLMTKWLKGIAGDRQVGVHCHDSLGIGTACALSGVEAGAEVVHTSVNGMSDGGGLAAFEEVVLALSSIYGFDLGIKLERLKELSNMVQEITKVKIHPYKSIVGDSVFVEGPDSHLEKIMKGEAKWSDTFFVNPEAIGQKLQLVFGPSALGGRGIRAKAGQMGLSLSEGEWQKVLEAMKESLKIKGGLTEDEIEILIKEPGGAYSK